MCAEAPGPSSRGHTPGSQLCLGKGARASRPPLPLPSGAELTPQVTTFMVLPPKDATLPWSKETHFSQRLMNSQISLLEEVMQARISVRFFRKGLGELLTEQ